MTSPNLGLEGTAGVISSNGVPGARSLWLRTLGEEALPLQGWHELCPGSGPVRKLCMQALERAEDTGDP